MSAVLPDGAAVLTHADLLTVFSALADAAAYRVAPGRLRQRCRLSLAGLSPWRRPVSAHKGRQQRHQLCARCKHSVARHVHYDDWRSDCGDPDCRCRAFRARRSLRALAEEAFMTGYVWFALLLLALSYPLLAVTRRVRRRRSLRGHRLHHHRVRHMRLRLHLRLHPAHGCATAFEIWLRWGRLASFRESSRTRPSLGFWHRLTHPASHSYYVGRAHHHRSVRVTVQEHGALIGPPRSNKSALLSRIIMDAPGAVVVTSSKADIFTLTAAVRARRGPIWVFNPQDIGGIPSNVRWSPVDGAESPAVAIRRGSALAAATSTDGTEDAGVLAA